MERTEGHGFSRAVSAAHISLSGDFSRRTERRQFNRSGFAFTPAFGREVRAFGTAFYGPAEAVPFRGCDSPAKLEAVAAAEEEVEQQEDEQEVDDAATVVAVSRASIVAAATDEKNDDDEKNNHVR
jgi:hypothetical protein